MNKFIVLLLSILPNIAEAAWQQCTACQQCPKYCPYYYAPQIKPKPPSEITGILVQAHKTVLSKQYSSFYGDALVWIDDYWMKCQQLEIFWLPDKQKASHANLQTDIGLYHHDFEVYANSASIDFLTKKTILHDSKYILYGTKARGSAVTVAISENKFLTLSKATYTTCPPQDNQWSLNARRIFLDKEAGMGYAQQVVLQVKDVPMLYLPKVNFPLDKRRHSGFLMPQLELNSMRGASLAIPYYFNLAPNYDWLISTRIYKKRALAINNTWRYLLDKQQGKIFFDAKLAKTTNIDNKVYGQYLGWQHAAQLTNSWHIKIDLHKAQDINYFYLYHNNARADSSYGFRDTLEHFGYYTPQTIKLYSHSSYGKAHVQWHQYQGYHPLTTSRNLQLSTIRQLPQIEYRSANLIFADNGAANIIVQSTNYKDFLKLKSTHNIQRHYVQGYSGYKIGMPGYYMLPQLHMFILNYSKTNAVHKTLVLPVVIHDIVATRAKYSSNVGKYNLVTSGILRYQYAPKYDNINPFAFDSKDSDINVAQLFRVNRLSGFDQLAINHQISGKLTNAWYHKHTNDEFVRWSVASGYYLRPVMPQLYEPLQAGQRWMPLANEVDLNLHANMQINSLVVINARKVITNDLALKYLYADSSSIQIGYQYAYNGNFKHHKSQQIRLQLQHLLNANWQLYLAFNYNLLNEKSVYQNIEIQYKNCCLHWSLGIRVLRSLETLSQYTNSKKIYFKVYLPGLGGL